MREDSNGSFFVGPYVDSSGTAYPKQRAAAYKALSARYKGPFPSVLDWYDAMAELNRKSALEDPEEEGDRDVTVAEYELLAELSDKIIVDEFKSGPFVINHNDLTVQNILVRNCRLYYGKRYGLRIFRLMKSSTSLVFSTSQARSYHWPHSVYSRGYLVIILQDWSQTVTHISMCFSPESVAGRHLPCNHGSYGRN